MHTQPENDLLRSYANMTDRDRKMLVSYARACARENPRPQPRLTVIIGGRVDRSCAFPSDISGQAEDLRPSLIVRT